VPYSLGWESTSSISSSKPNKCDALRNLCLLDSASQENISNGNIRISNNETLPKRLLADCSDAQHDAT
jgi:hypothetical protein